MVGIFSRFSSGRRTQSSVDVRGTLPQNVEVVGSAPAPATYGIETTVEFKPVEHPIEPIDKDQPVKCPLPEPSILNDGRIWKERMSTANARMRSDLPALKEGSNLGPEASGNNKPRPSPPKWSISPSLSAPEHNLTNFLDECNAAQDHNTR